MEGSGRMKPRHLPWMALLVCLLVGIWWTPVAVGDDLSEAFIKAAERIRPSVVFIQVTKKEQAGPSVFRRFEMPDSPELPEGLRRFFRRSEPPQGLPEGTVPESRRGNRPRFRQRGLPQIARLAVGSGVIYSEKGYIITNNHVAKDAEKIEVVLQDGDTVEAHLVASDPNSDLAVIKVDTDHELTPAHFADTDDLRIGQWVLAVGSPFGLTHSVSAGIISGLGRNVGAIHERFAYEGFIQTDADINKGSSGGALVDLDGEVIGICVAIASENNMGFTPYPGTGFAIPADRVIDVAQQLIDRGKVVRGYLGVALRTMEPAQARSLGLKVKEAVHIIEVLPDSPAAAAGVQPDDLVVRYQGEKVIDLDDFRSRVADTKPGTEAELVVLRDGKEVTLKITIGEQPEPVKVAEESVSSDWGLQLQTLTKDLAEQMGYAGLTGAVITDVEPDSPADKAELEPGDLILEVAKKPVTSAEGCAKALSEAGDKALVRVKKPSGEAVYRTLTRP